MGGHIKPIGGEQWFDIELFDNKLDNFNNTKAIFLRGGQSAIQFILEVVDIKPDEYILMPSYLCPSILYNLKRLNIKYEFYKINRDLSINIDDIKDKVGKFKIRAIFFIDYFGFYHSKESLEYLENLKNENIIIIEDAVQMLWFNRKNFIGDYVFNSYRKFLPIDGSIVLCKKIKNFNFSRDNYFDIVNLARLKKTAFQNFNIGKEEDFLKLYERAEEEYYKTDYIIAMDNESKKMLSKINYDLIADARKRNYAYLFDRLIKNHGVKIIFDKSCIEDNTVLGLPILVENRDEIRNKLREFNIYTPVHWNILNEKWSDKYLDSMYISKRILALPIDQRYDLNDMNRLVNSINNLVWG